MSPTTTSRRPRTIQAEEFDTEEVLSSYSESFLDCRGINHPWQQIGFYRDGGSTCRLLVCTRYGTERVDRWTANGERLKNNYRNRPDGYQIRGHHVSHRDIRQEILRRVRVFDTYQAMTDAAKRRGRRRTR